MSDRIPEKPTFFRYIKLSLNALPFMVLFALAILAVIEVALVLSIIYTIGTPAATESILSQLFFMAAMGGILMASIKIGWMLSQQNENID